MISLIVAFDKQQTIGQNNQIPWHYPEDLKYFKTVTMGHPLLMGRNTFESLLSYGGPLKGRHHYVLTHNKTYHYEHPDVTIIHDYRDILEQYRHNSEELFIIGGAALYRQLLDEAQLLYITEIDASYEGDTFFPPVNWSYYHLLSQRQQGPLTFSIYQKRT